MWSDRCYIEITLHIPLSFLQYTKHSLQSDTVVANSFASKNFTLKPSYINNPYLYADLGLVNFVFFHFEGENECVISRLTACIYIYVLKVMT